MPDTCMVCHKVGVRAYFSLPAKQSEREAWVDSAKLNVEFKENYKKKDKICWRHFPPAYINRDGLRIALRKGEFFIAFYLIIMITLKTSSLLYNLSFLNPSTFETMFSFFIIKAISCTLS